MIIKTKRKEREERARKRTDEFISILKAHAFEGMLPGESRTTKELINRASAKAFDLLKAYPDEKHFLKRAIAEYSNQIWGCNKIPCNF